MNAVVERVETVAGAMLFGFILAALFFNAVRNPLDHERTQLELETLRLAAGHTNPVQVESQTSAWGSAVRSRSKLWEPLVALSPATHCGFAKPDAQRQLEETLVGIVVERNQIGARARIVDTLEGTSRYLGVGDTVRGVPIRVIEPDYIEFFQSWGTEEPGVRLRIPRQFRTIEGEVNPKD